MLPAILPNPRQSEVSALSRIEISQARPRAGRLPSGKFPTGAKARIDTVYPILLVLQGANKAPCLTCLRYQIRLLFATSAFPSSYTVN